VRLGFSIQFTGGRTDQEKQVQVWAYPAQDGDVLAPLRIMDQYAATPDLNNFEDVEAYMMACLINLQNMILLKRAAGSIQAIEELRVALDERKIQ